MRTSSTTKLRKADFVKNILSYVTPLSGREIKDWIVEHTTRQTEYSKIARTMLRYMNLADSAMYRIDVSPVGTGIGERRKGRPNVTKIKNAELSRQNDAKK